MTEDLWGHFRQGLEIIKGPHALRWVPLAAQALAFGLALAVWGVWPLLRP